jgi:uncharacterized protein
MTTQRLFHVAVGALALHVADDTFIQPQPGTSAGDHLVSGLVPLAALALAAWGYPRLRAGLRSLLALSLALTGFAGAIEGVHAANSVGLAGDDYTSLLCIPAALLLVGIGIAELWRSRRTGDRLYVRYPRRALRALGGLLVLFMLALPIAVGYGFTHVTRTETPDYELGVAHEDVTLTTSDELELKGWYVPSRNGAAVIVYPGRAATQDRAKFLIRHGYGVLLYDRRGEGESEGDVNTYGWDFDKDIRAGVEFLERRSDVDPDRIAGLGLSVGGEMMLQTAADTTGLAAVVSEGAGSRTIGEELDDEDVYGSGFQKWFNASGIVLKSASMAVFSGTMPPDHLADLVPKIAPRPIMLIWAKENDTATLSRRYLEAAGPTATGWEVPEGGHTGGLKARPAEYERRVVSFLDRALRVGGRSRGTADPRS